MGRIMKRTAHLTLERSEGSPLWGCRVWTPAEFLTLSDRKIDQLTDPVDMYAVELTNHDERPDSIPGLNGHPFSALFGRFASEGTFH